MDRPGTPQLRASVLLREHDVSIGAELLEHSGRAAVLMLDREVPPDSALRLDIGDKVLLGEVYWCEETQAGWRTSVALDQAISSVRDLTRLVRALLGEEEGRATTPR